MRIKQIISQLVGKLSLRSNVNYLLVLTLYGGLLGYNHMAIEVENGRSLFTMFFF